MKYKIWIPKEYIPAEGTIARKQWDDQVAQIAEDERKEKARIEKRERNKAFKRLIAGAFGKTSKKNGAYLLPE